ncbi:DMT family transporter [Acinetobacter bohemicus]|uniref:EamA-like transporter family protein n=1 Tax=Acinetobacter bohemicus TaxID=1435036 RepID=A0A1I6RGX4_9GAMM|nr:DMT family transporter [Acinetobacter bohemicus]KAB0653528.1 DMT family transporter [Acinetobacter bohemicus]SFS63840.1 EamA-like transporter family protein [Acinetobacter bohemicus]
MELILAAACCSVIVSILLKFAKAQGFDALQMIVWNYASASVLCFLWFKPDLQHVSIINTPWWLIIALGVLLPSVFLCLAKSLQYAGIVKTEIAQRLSVVLSLLAAFFIFQEQFNTLKIIGIVLGVFAVLSLLFSHQHDKTGQSSTKQAMLYLALVWFGYALIDVLLKYTTGLGLQFAVALNLMFICAFILSLAYIVMTTKTTAGNRKNILAGMGLGLLNFANIALYVKAHMLLKDTPAIVFAGMNILVVVLGAFSGLIIFKEKLTPTTALGLTLGLASVICLGYAISV